MTTDQGDVLQLIRRSGMEVAPVLPPDLAPGPYHELDLSESNRDLNGVDLGGGGGGGGGADPVAFGGWVDREMARARATVGVGRYGENRVIYRHSELFGGGEARSVHLGVDLFVPPGVAVSTLLAGHVHSVGHNRARGDYGPTVIVEHQLQDVRFWTLYGHLSLGTLEERAPGQQLDGGAVVGWIGEHDVNGGWPPHLHFQLITDIGDRRGDFPGVAAPSEQATMLALCPNPMPLLGAL